MRQRYREGQEDQLGALGLVVNMVVLWNTRYMDKAITQLKMEGVVIKDEDVARLSPLGFSHINMQGRYEFKLAESLAVDCDHCATVANQTAKNVELEATY